MDGPPEPGAARGPTETALAASRARSVLSVLPVAVAMAFFGSMLTATNGHFVPQVVDLYVCGSTGPIRTTTLPAP